MSRPTYEQLEALVYGDLEPHEAADVEQRAADDDDATDELAWLRTERAMMLARAEREQPLPASLWDGVAARIEAEAEPATAEAKSAGTPWWRSLWPEQDKARWFGLGLATAAAAAAALVIMTTPPAGNRGSQTGGVATGGADLANPVPAQADASSETPDPADKLAAAERALADAELAHVAALDALEEAYREQRDQFEPELAARYDHEFLAARRVIDEARTTTDLHERRRMLTAYSTQVSALQSVVFGLEETAQ